VKAHRQFAGHDPTEISTNIMKRHDVLGIIVQPPDDIIIHHQIYEASVVSRINLAPRRLNRPACRSRRSYPGAGVHEYSFLKFSMTHAYKHKETTISTQLYTNKYFSITYAYKNTIISTIYNML